MILPLKLSKGYRANNNKRASNLFLKKVLNKRNITYFLLLLILTPFLYFCIQQYRIYKVRAAATIIWDGGGDGISWSDSLNWNTDTIPIATDSVLIDTATTVNISAPTTIYSLTLGSVAGNIATILQFNFDSITPNTPLLIDGGDLTVYFSAVITHSVPTTTTINGTVNISVTTGDVNVLGAINVNEKGYKDGYGPGAGVDGSSGAGGASHAGVGGNGKSRLGSTIIYGSSTQPVSLGSGGGDNNDNTGGKGGGAIKLTVSGNIIVNGGISANGEKGSISGNDGGGGGSGGSIWIFANSISGASTISANGGNAVDAYYDGGGGGGGRIALYLKDKLSVPLENLSVNGGTAYGSAQPGGSGSLQILGYPYNPISLQQFKSNGTTAIAIGGSTEEDTFTAKFQIEDANSSDILIPEVEIQPIGTSFNNVATHTGTEVSYSGNTLTSNIIINGLADTQGYHWQARVCDAGNEEISLCSEWVSAGNNTEQEPDISVVMNTNPNTPVIGESSYYINGQYTNYIQPTFSFVLSDPNSLDSVGYQFQLATDSSFTSILVDYISSMDAQGVQYFTVGQQVGEGTYNTGDISQQLSAGSYYWRVKTLDNKSGISDWSVASGNPSFIIDLSLPENASNVIMRPYVDSINEYSESENSIWFNRNDLYFEWDEGRDTEEVKGYCLYLGDLSEGNPGTEKGLLGTSPLSTSGSTCQFITDQTHIDFSNSALRGTTWLSSSNAKYYFKVKTIDIANNIYDGPDTTNYISFYFDNTPPENVTAISAPSTTFSSLSDIFFTWPISENNGGSDLHSQLLGFQFALNTKNTWYGAQYDSVTGLNYYLLSTTQPFNIPENILPLINLGQNTIFFRLIDKAGNTSELRTIYINYGGESPKFTEGEEVIASPTSSSTNYFSFNWPEAIISEGNQLKKYYYMINTEPPSSYQTITSNSATYIPTTERTISARSIPGLIKGSNTIYVVAVDDKDNYSPSNYISATFNLKTELPDPPTNIIIADSSIKDASIWRAALIWDEPEYKGTGTLRYTIQRSENGTTWNTVQSTTGLAHIDTVPTSKQYYWRIGTTDNSDESINNPSYSTAVSITPRGKYTSPSNLTSGPAVSSITTTRALISWTTHRISDSKIAFGLASGNYFDWEPSVSKQTTEHQIPLSNLKPGTQYFYVSKWTDEDGNTGVSDEKSFITAPPPEVKDVRISNLGVNSVMVSFTTKNATSTRIYYGTSTSFGGIKEIGTSKLETTYSIELNNLQDGMKYYFKINTFDDESEEYEGTILDFKTLPKPRVSNVLVQQVAKTAQSTLLVTWESNTEITSIITFYPEKNPELVQDVVDLKMIKGDHKMLIKGLLPDTAYILNVRGKDVIGNEAISGNIKINTSSDSRPPRISEMNIEGSNIILSNNNSQDISSQLIVTWTSDEPATSQVEYGEGSSDTYSQLTQEDKNLSYNHVVVISGLTPSKVYHLRAISKDIAGNESASIDTVTITPKSTNSAFNLVINVLQEAFTFLSNF